MVGLLKLRRLLPLRWRQLQPDSVLDLGPHVALPPGFRPTNPSIVEHQGQLLVNVRGVGYEVDERLRVVAGSQGVRSVNRQLLLDRNLTVHGAAPGAEERLDGLEDLKLFHFRDRPWAIGSRRVADPRTEFASAIALLDLAAPDGQAERQLASPYGFAQEKNWAPFVHAGALHLLYCWKPMVVLRHDPERHALEPVPGPLPPRDSLAFLEGGSSAGVGGDSHYTFLTHRRVVRLPSRRRIYVTRLRQLGADLQTVHATGFFTIGTPTVQFCNGLVVDAQHVFIAYGEMDARALIARFPRRDFETVMGLRL